MTAPGNAAKLLAIGLLTAVLAFSSGPAIGQVSNGEIPSQGHSTPAPTYFQSIRDSVEVIGPPILRGGVWGEGRPRHITLIVTVTPEVSRDRAMFAGMMAVLKAKPVIVAHRFSLNNNISVVVRRDGTDDGIGMDGFDGFVNGIWNTGNEMVTWLEGDPDSDREAMLRAEIMVYAIHPCIRDHYAEFAKDADLVGTSEDEAVWYWLFMLREDIELQMETHYLPVARKLPQRRRMLLYQTVLRQCQKGED